MATYFQINNGDFVERFLSNNMFTHKHAFKVSKDVEIMSIRYKSTRYSVISEVADTDMRRK